MSLWSQNVDIYTEVNESMNSTVETEVDAVQDCSATTGCTQTIDSEGCDNVTYDDVSFDCETQLNTSCIQDDQTQVSVQNEIEQDASVTADMSMQAMTCGASAGGSAALLSGGTSASCALPQSMSMKQQTYVNSAIDLYTLTQTTYENDCSLNAQTTQTLSCSDSTGSVYTNIDYNSYMDDSIDCTLSSDTVVSSYTETMQTMTSDTTTATTQGTWGISGALCALLIIILLIAMLSGSSKDKNKAELGYKEKPNSLLVECYLYDRKNVGVYHDIKSEKQREEFRSKLNSEDSDLHVSNVRDYQTRSMDLQSGQKMAWIFGAISMFFIVFNIVGYEYTYGIDPNADPNNPDLIDSIYAILWIITIILIACSIGYSAADANKMKNNEFDFFTRQVVGKKLKKLKKEAYYDEAPVETEPATTTTAVETVVVPTEVLVENEESNISTNSNASSNSDASTNSNGLEGGLYSEIIFPYKVIM